MSGWRSESLDITGGWGNENTKGHNLDYNRPANQARVRAVIFHKRNAALFLEEERQIKKIVIEKGTLFDLFTTSVHNVIGNCLAKLEHRIKFNDVVI